MGKPHPRWPLLLLPALALLVAATYTWLSLGQRGTVGDMEISVSTGSGLLLGPTAEGSWHETIDFSSIVSGSGPLRPCTWSEAENRPVTVDYGPDGRAEAALSAGTPEESGYLAGTFYAYSDTLVEVSLQGPEQVGNLVTGTYVRESGDGTQGTSALRIGLLVTIQGETAFYYYDPAWDAQDSVPSATISGLFSQKACLWQETNQGWRLESGGEFLTKPTLFTLEPGAVAKIDLFLWLEGTDEDWDGSVATEVTASICFETTYPQGLEEIAPQG